MIATKDSWKRQAFTTGTPIPYRRSFSRNEFAKVQEGLVPEDMDDKWFIYFDDYLFLHRSWTGEPVYRVEFSEDGTGVSVAEALCAEEAGDTATVEQHADLLNFLIGNLLLGEAHDFPLPSKAKTKIPGLLQHIISGTSFPEAGANKPSPRRPWWVFWRR